MQARLDDNLVEYAFTIEEKRMAMLLDPLKVAYLHTIRAQLIKLKASRSIPVVKELEMEYIAFCIEIDGKIGLIQELMDNSAQALKEYNEAKQQDAVTGAQSSEANLAERAAKQVDRIQTL